MGAFAIHEFATVHGATTIPEFTDPSARPSRVVDWLPADGRSGA